MEAVRESRFDVLKGLGILMMVSGHASAPLPLRNFFGTFHMAVFFILAGWFFDFRYAQGWDSLLTYARKRLVRLWWPFAFWSALFMVSHNLLARVHLVHDLPFFFGSVPEGYVAEPWSLRYLCLQLAQAPLMLGDNTHLAGAFWFLKTLLFSTVGYCGVSWLFGKTMRRGVLFGQTAISVLLLLVSSNFSVPYAGVIGGDQVFTAYALVHAGVLMRRFDVRLDRLKPLGGGAAALFCFAALLVLSRHGQVSLALNRYPSVGFLLAASLCGWFFLCALSTSIHGRARNVLAYVGRHSLSIVLLHYLAFKVVSVVAICCYSLPMSRLSEMGSVAPFGAWWVAYAAVGIGLPLCLSAASTHLLHVLRNRWTMSARSQDSA